eukprot:Nitzschia sp. Nitz4//scaffold4_size323378//311970//317685//NITZ4_000719-RA/size323378-snap-gene-0.432-mRNA-1//1//CDS//3329553576//9455//frame0
MGRNNNKRAQAAAAALRNTPARARFSSGPPRKSTKPKRNDDKGKNSNNPHRRNQATEATTRVIDKLQTRVQQEQKVATSDEAVQTWDVSKLDYLQLPSAVFNNITNLLEDLGVKETSVSRKDKDTDMDDPEYSDVPTVDDSEELDATPQIENPSTPYWGNGGYTEYEDDAEPENFGVVPSVPMGDDGDDVDEMDDSDQEQENETNQATNLDLFRENSAFIHLTQKLSFSQDHALRACQAIQNWGAVSENEADEENKGKNDSREMITLALDWLCLHLAEEQLTQGLRPNPNPPTTLSRTLIGPKAGVRVIGSIKAVPHPSISLDMSVTNDKVWARSVRLQDRVLKFVTKLGFHYEEATNACEQTSSEDENIDMALTRTPPDEDPALIPLLVQLRRKASIAENIDLPEEPPNETDKEYAAQEQQEEREALQAIYEEHIDFIQHSDRTHGMNKYLVRITPTEPLEAPARSEDCHLHFFLPSGYPVLEPILCLFTNPSLPPSLLRQVNELCSTIALEGIGVASVFSIVPAISDALPGLHQTFIREQRRKEFEAEQIKLRKQAGHNVDSTVDALYDTDGKIGRRQRARLKAAEKAFGRDEQQRKEEQAQRQREDTRIQRVQEQNTRVREIHAEHAIRQREKEHLEHEAERVSRAAMSNAFNRGESKESARLAAHEARAAFMREHQTQIEDEEESSEPNEMEDPMLTESHEQSAPTQKTAAFMERLREQTGVNDLPESGGDHLIENPEEKVSENFAETTPTTVAFMERLRQMYDGEAKKKSGIRLTLPKEKSSETSNRVPCPVAMPTGEVGDEFRAVVKQQEEQPWLIAPEARVPVSSEIVADEAQNPEQNQKQADISNKLRLELQTKLEEARKLEVSGFNPTRNAEVSRKSHMYSPEQYQFMLSVRKRLPAYKMARDVVDTINVNQVTVIAGDTGCGKTTQVPQLVLDDRILNGFGAMTNIIVTQPRRISAIGVSERIADERCEKVGDTCGYSIKLEKKVSSRTRLLLCTTGVLLRRLQCDPDLATVSHIFVDEVHERDLNTDFLIIVLKDLLARRKNLKLVLMSATLNSDAFSRYFAQCPVVSIPGRAHPVKENRLEDILEFTGYQVQEHSDYARKTDNDKPPKISKSKLRQLYYPKYSKETIHSLSIVDEEVINYELIATLLEKITLAQDEGAILVFMPGMMEITKTIDEMYKKELFQSDRVRIYPLHSSLSTAEQTAIFEVPPKGVRKIVVGTNIAETSITIEDVVYVVDAGRVKENRRDEMNETPTLVECWVSRASAKQRRGRAGRVRPGIAYHLYSSHTHDSDLSDYQLPEMLRVGIEDLMLQVLVLDLGEPVSFLGKALNPPSDLAMSNSLKLLESLGAIECEWKQSALRRPTPDTDSEADASHGNLRVTSQLTALGFHLAALPVDSRVGKLMIYGSLFGCVDPALTIAASMSSRTPFVSPFDQRDAADEARKGFAVNGSDHLTILNAYTQWKLLREKKAPRRKLDVFLKESFLSYMALNQMENLKEQYAKLLKDLGFLPNSFRVKNCAADETSNVNSSNLGLVKAILCAGLYPNILVAPRNVVADPSNPRMKGDKKVGECAFQSRRNGEVHLHPSTIGFDQNFLDSRYCCYHEIVKTSKTYARDTTTISPFALLLFGGSLEVFQAHGVCRVDHWLKFRLDPKPATLVKYLRHQMEKMLLKKIVDPQDDIVETSEGQALIRSINLLFAGEVASFSKPIQSGGEIVRPWTGSDEPENNNYRTNVSGHGRGRGGRGGSNSGRIGHSQRQGGRGRGRGGRGGGRGGRGRGRN